METQIWHIIWRDRVTGNIRETAKYDYPTWYDTNEALEIMHHQKRNFTAVIERIK